MVEREGSYNIEIIERGHLKIEVFIGRILVAMYVHCGLLAKAQIVFETLLTGSRLYFVLECTYFEIYPRGENEESSKMISSACTLEAILTRCTSSLKACCNLWVVGKRNTLPAQTIADLLSQKDVVWK